MKENQEVGNTFSLAQEAPQCLRTLFAESSVTAGKPGSEECVVIGQGKRGCLCLGVV